MEFRDLTFILNAKTTDRKLTTGQIISLTIGFNNLSNDKNDKNDKMIIRQIIKKINKLMLYY